MSVELSDLLHLTKSDAPGHPFSKTSEDLPITAAHTAGKGQQSRVRSKQLTNLVQNEMLAM